MAITLIDSYSESNGSAALTVVTSGLAGQSFLNPTSIPLYKCKFYLQGTVTGSVYARIYAHTGTFGTNGKPANGSSPLAISDAVNASTIPASYGLVEFTFSGSNVITLGAATNYCVEFYNASSGNISVRADSTSSTHGGNLSFSNDNGANWSTLGSYDTIFYIYGGVPKTLTFAGVDYLPYYKSNTVKIKEKLRKTNVMNLEVVTKAIAQAPQEGSEVIYIDGTSGTRYLFGGYITKVTTVETGKGDLFNFAVEVSDYSYIFGDKEASRAYSNKTLNEIVVDLIADFMDAGYGFTTTNVDTGPVIDSILFDHLSLNKCFEKLSKLTGYVWWVDYQKNIYFKLPVATVDPAPETITDASANVESINISYDATQVRNSITVIGSIDGVDSLDLITESFVGDGETTSWQIDEYPSSVVSIKVNGVTQQFSLDLNERDTDQMLYSYSGKNFRVGIAGVTPAIADTIVIEYYPKLPVIEQVTDPASIAFFAALDGGDGVKEYTIKEPSITSIAEANARGKQELEEYSMPLVDGKIVTRSGLLTAGSVFRPGQMLTLNIPSQGLATDTAFLIQEVGITLNEDGTNTEYSYEITFGGKVIGVGEFLEYLAAQSSAGTEVSDSDQILTIEHVTDQMEFSDSDVAISIAKQTPPYKYKTGSPQGVWGLSEWK